MRYKLSSRFVATKPTTSVFMFHVQFFFTLLFQISTWFINIVVKDVATIIHYLPPLALPTFSAQLQQSASRLLRCKLGKPSASASDEAVVRAAWKWMYWGRDLPDTETLRCWMTAATSLDTFKNTCRNWTQLLLKFSSTIYFLSSPRWGNLNTSLLAGWQGQGRGEAENGENTHRLPFYNSPLIVWKALRSGVE